MSIIHLLVLAVHLLATIAKFMRPGGVRAVVAKSLLLKQQLLISGRARRRAPNLNSFDRFVLGLASLFIPVSRLPKLAVVLKPKTLLQFHEALKKRKYRWLFSSGGHRRPGPKGCPCSKSPQGGERLVIFASRPYRQGHGGDSHGRCSDHRFPFSQPRRAGA